LNRACSGVHPDILAIESKCGWDKRVGEPETVQNDLCRIMLLRRHVDSEQGKDSLIHDSMLLTKSAHFLIPMISFIPSVLYHLNFFYFAKLLEDVDIVGVTHTYELHFAFILKS
jgi:hypothetical protein